MDVAAQNIDNFDPEAAIIYPILLDNSIEVIRSLPGNQLQYYGTKISQQEQLNLSQQLRQYLNPVFPSSAILPASQELYNLLIRPADNILKQEKIKTLVFIPDGFLRNLPMGILHDGNQYLIEKYNLAITPGLQLFLTDKLSINNFKILTGGLTEARQGFSPLPSVETEIKQISSIAPSETLLNEEFTNPQVSQRVENNPISIVHLATHGQFSSNIEDTFILTWDGRINVKDLDNLLVKKELTQPIELLVLSACKTAKGDDRAILGLAGIAIRSGARSTVATLWSVSDRSTAKLMTQFYQYLYRQNTSKSDALRQAQLSLLHSSKYKHPYYWSPFILVGNWQ